MKIEKSYSRNISLGNYETIRLGLTIKYDKDIESKEDLKKVSVKLTKLAAEIINKELETIKEERNGGQ